MRISDFQSLSLFQIPISEFGLNWMTFPFRTVRLVNFRHLDSGGKSIKIMDVFLNWSELVANKVLVVS